MHQKVKRLVGVAAVVATGVLVANANAVPVPCGAIDAVWQEQAAVAGNYPECESYYDHSNLDQTVDLDSDHPHMARFSACKRYGATTWACPTIGEHEVDDATDPEKAEEAGSLDQRASTNRWKYPGAYKKREADDATEPEQAEEAGSLDKRASTNRWKHPGAWFKREVIDNTQPEQEAKGANNEPPKAGGLVKQQTSTAQWEKPGTRWVKREVIDNTQSEQARGLKNARMRGGAFCRRAWLANWRCPGAGKREAQDTKGDDGNWAPHKRDALIGIGLAHAASHIDAHGTLGLDVASKPPGNWPPHKRFNVADEEE